MGIVYRAEQREPIRRHVALKLIKRGMDSDQVLARFAAERQALALMKHRNIARVLDAGTVDDGRPYFVMELVDGLPITEFCDVRALSVHERLNLFLSVCSGIEHAHQKGLIHRDIKPGNVLVEDVEGAPTPRVIDFGLAKAMHQPLIAETLHTQVGTVMGTLAYMSPEQASGRISDIDTRTDVYALGVLLYELLTGLLPFESERLQSVGLAEAQRILNEEDPPRPSTQLSHLGARGNSAAIQRAAGEPRALARILEGDLDWIVLKAIEKRPERRYGSVQQLAADLENYLNDRPVQASPPSLSYRFRKFVRRHRLLTLNLALGLLVLTLATATSLSFAFEAHRERAQALAERSRAESGRRVALGAFDFDKSPTIALAHAISALEIVDSAEGRRLAQRALARPVGFQLDPWGAEASQVQFSPDGRFLAAAGGLTALWDTNFVSRILADASRPTARMAFNQDARTVTSVELRTNTLRTWTLADGQQLLERDFPDAPALTIDLTPDGAQVVQLARVDGVGTRVTYSSLEGAPAPGEDVRSRLVAADLAPYGSVGARGETSPYAIGPTGSRFAWSDQHDVFVVSVDDLATAEPIKLTGHSADVFSLSFSGDGSSLASYDRDGGIRVWSLGAAGSSAPEQRSPIIRTGPGWPGSIHLGGAAARLAVTTSVRSSVLVWDLEASPAARPTAIALGDLQIYTATFHPRGNALAIATTSGVVFFPIREWSSELDSRLEFAEALSWSPSTHSLVSFNSGTMQLATTPLQPHAAGSDRLWSWPEEIIGRSGRAAAPFALDPEGRFVVLAAAFGPIRAVPLEQGDPRVLGGIAGGIDTLDLDPTGNLLAIAASTTRRRSASRELLLWRLDTGNELLRVDVGRGQVRDLALLNDGTLWTARDSGVDRWVAFSSGQVAPAPTRILPEGARRIAVDRRGSLIALLLESGVFVLHQPDSTKPADSQVPVELVGHRSDRGVTSIAVDPTGRFVASADSEGIVRVTVSDPLSHDAPYPYVLVGHDSPVVGLAFHGNGQSLAASAVDGSVRLWRLPEGRPLLALDQEGFLEVIRAHTNLRLAVEEETGAISVETEPLIRWEE